MNAADPNLARYRRHIQLPGFGIEKQQKLLSSRILIMGAGGLGCPTALYLAAAGIGTLGIADFDIVSLNNLHRQVAHTTHRVGTEKTDSLIKTLTALNPDICYQAHSEKLSVHNIESIILNYDLILDGTDNFATRYLVADACYLHNKPLLHGAVSAYEGQLALFVPHKTPCYRCLYQAPPTRNAIPACSELGILGVVPGTLGLMMATEAIKFLTGLGQSMAGRLLLFDALGPTLRTLNLSSDRNCPLCGNKPSIQHIEASRYDTPSCEETLSLTMQMAQKEISKGAIWLDVREPFEYEHFHLPSAQLLSVNQMDADRTQSLPTDTLIIAYCQAGARSQMAVNRLRQLGFDNVVSLEGGLQAWDKAATGF